MDLYDPIQASYESQKDAEKRLSNYNYKYDHDLSDMDTKIFYNPDEAEHKKLLVTFRGSKRISDYVPTDLSILTGGFSHSKRHNEAKHKLHQAKQKYNTDKALLVGHSMGGSLGSAVGSDKDLIYTFNKGAGGLFNHNTHTKANEHSYRMDGDIVSLLSKYNTRKTNTLGKSNILNAHNTNNLKKYKIII